MRYKESSGFRFVDSEKSLSSKDEALGERHAHARN